MYIAKLSFSSYVAAWSPHVDVNKMNDHAGILLAALRNEKDVRVAHETSVLKLTRFYEKKLRFDHRYVQWLLTDHRTLGLVVEDMGASRSLWAVGFEDRQPRRLSLIA